MVNQRLQWHANHHNYRGFGVGETKQGKERSKCNRTIPKAQRFKREILTASSRSSSWSSVLWRFTASMSVVVMRGLATPDSRPRVETIEPFIEDAAVDGVPGYTDRPICFSSLAPEIQQQGIKFTMAMKCENCSREVTQSNRFLFLVIFNTFCLPSLIHYV